MFELIVAGFMFVALIFYAVTGDADYGGGMWDLLATGPRAGAQRDAIERAIGPIWEADHVWLILIVVILFTAFPPAFAAMMTALNIPFTLDVNRNHPSRFGIYFPEGTTSNLKR